jgi:hypothetical protein
VSACLSLNGRRRPALLADSIFYQRRLHWLQVVLPPHGLSLTMAKILVAGDVNGDLDACFARVATVNSAHGPFACLLCVGDFLGKPEDAVALLAPFKAGEREPPLPTYFLGPPGGALPSEVLASTDAGGLVAPGITCLGAAGIHVLSGLKVAFISGAQRDAEQLPPNGVAELKRLSQLPGAAAAHSARPFPPPTRRPAVLQLQAHP